MAPEGLYVSVKTSWCSTFRSELLSFPVGKHDDQVDALGLVGQLLDQMLPGQKPKPPEKPKLDSLVKEKGLENTEIVLNGDTPGGEARVAKTGPRKQQANRAKTRGYGTPRFGRRDWFQRRFSGRSQGFYWRY